MKLRRLELQCFRQHRNSVIEFHDGLTGIVGFNGAGKTTLVESIAFALYGSKALRGTVSHARSRRAERGVQTKVVLAFEHEGNGYFIDRRLDGAECYLGGERDPLASGTTPVTEWVQDLLRMTYEEFSATYLTEQKSLEFLRGKRGTAERERFVLRMFGFDRIEEAQRLLREHRREIQLQEDTLRVSEGGENLVGELEKLSEDLTRAERELTASQEALAAAQESSRAAREDLARLSPRLESTREAWQKRTTLEAQLAACGVRLAEKEEELQELTVLSGETHSSLSLEEAEQKIEELNQKEQELEVQQQGLRSQWDREQATHRERIVTARENFTQMAEQVRLIERADENALCPTCEQPLATGQAALLERLREKVQQARATVTALESLSTQRAVPPAALVATTSELTVVKREKTSLELQLRELQREEEWRVKQERLSLEVQRLHDERHQLQSELSTQDQESEEQEKLLALHQLALKKSETADRLLEVSRLQHVRAQGLVDTKRALVERCRHELMAARDVIARRESLGLERVRCDQADELLTKFRKAINAEFRPALAERASSFLTDLSEGRYAQVDIAQDFTPTVVEDGESKEVISGGEEDLLQLCVRLALSSLLAERSGHHFSLLILDEVFGSLDSHRREGVLSLLESLKSRFEQVILISHFSDVKDWVDNLITVTFDETVGDVWVTQGNSSESDSAEFDKVENF